MANRKTSPAQSAFTARASRGYWETYACRPDGEWFHSYGDSRTGTRWTPCADPRRADGSIEPLQDLFTCCGVFYPHTSSECSSLRLPLGKSYTQEREARLAQNSERIAQVTAMIEQFAAEHSSSPAIMHELIDAKLRELRSELEALEL